MRELCVAILLIVSIYSAHGQSRDTGRTESEIAAELFGLVAEQSRCSIYVVAWIDPVTQQIVSRCAETLVETDHVASMITTKIRFFIDVSKALAEIRQRARKSALPRSAAVLAHLLADNRGIARRNDSRAPLLVYRYSERQSDATSGKAKVYSGSTRDTIFLFADE